MSHPILEKYRSLQPLNDEPTTNAILQQLVEIPRERLVDFFAASEHGGRFYLMRSSEFPGKVLEYVPDMAQDTSVTTLYTEHPIFESRQSLLDAREEIIGAIDELTLSVPGTMTVGDEGRGKQFHLFELGTAQLFDVLKHFVTH